MKGLEQAVELAAYVLDEPRRGKLGEQIRLEGRGVVPEGDAAHPGLAGRDDESAEGCGNGDVGDTDPGATAGVRRRRHAELLMRAFVNAARRAISGFVECGTHVPPPFQFLFESRNAARGGVLLG